MSQKTGFKLDLWVHKWHFSPPRHLVDNVPAATCVLGTCTGAGILMTSIWFFYIDFTACRALQLRRQYVFHYLKWSDAWSPIVGNWLSSGADWVQNYHFSHAWGNRGGRSLVKTHTVPLINLNILLGVLDARCVAMTPPEVTSGNLRKHEVVWI